MALALYRKYRPATFAEVVGQDHVTEPLRTALAAGRINHAYLFSGPRGCGKTSSARIMARSLNCVEGPTPDPCGKCGPCLALAPEGPGSVDVTELDAASHGGVDDARELRDRAFYAPAESRYRVFIIDEAHMVTTQGFNALLKIVEEPPEHLIFIFATTEPDKVLPTIRSRTHHYPFRLIPPSSMRELLERNVAAEGVQVEPAVYPLVIRAGGGSARDTQSVLDQLLAGAGPEGVTYARAVSLLGVTDVALIDAMVDALSADDHKAVFSTVDQLAEAGHDPRRFATDLLDRLRDLILLRSVPDAASAGMVSAPEEQLNRMVAQAERMQPGTLTRYAEIIHNGLLEMRGATAPRLLLELLCARMLLPEVAGDEAAMLQRLERLERRFTAGGPAPAAEPAAAPPPERTFERPSQRAVSPAPVGESPAPAGESPARAREVPAPAPKPASAPAARAEPVAEAAPVAGSEPGQIDAAALRQYWPQLLAAVRKLSRSTEAMLTNATVHSVEGSTVVLTHSAEPLARRLSEPRNADCIATALGQVMSGQWTVRCVHAGAVQASAAAAPARQAPAAPARQAPQPPQPSQPSQRQTSAEQQRSFQRPPAAEPPRRAVPATTEPDIPLPPEPEDEDDPYPAGPDAGGPPAAPAPEPADPEAIAHKLLSDHLGARPID
ncbi:DNA polymerase III subunit gamma and tau [Prauserella endophytica]|uniref:DNA polymerase III subunit gamma/tau n=1 Tax=Prauserella endophytica TaxID=1592324 RepID=A0ABY2S3N2_9PSEU|nr:DNA polymerase III subunit gamma and tau [Prauserella endophytica]TKG69952.1 DNA polymerase III subunit gamma and tau [Prauserella endophytica]